MNKLDSRIVRTRRALAESLIALALERGFENLSIAMVTERAGVGNRTFYRHFLSLDDLLIQTLTSAFQDLKERAFEAETPHGEVVAFFSFIRDHPGVLRVYVNLPWDHPARQVILTEAARFVNERYEAQNCSNVPLSLSVDHLILVSNNLVAWYLDQVDCYTPEQAADISDAIFLDALESHAIVMRKDWMQKRHQFR